MAGRIHKLIFTLLIVSYASMSYAAQMELAGSPIVLSDQVPDFNLAYKPNLVRMSSGTIIVVYGDAVEDDPAHYVYDLQSNTLRPARDVFVRMCTAGKADCSNIQNWSSPVNISNSATRTSIKTDWQGNADRMAYFGDADNAHVFASGTHVVVSWVDAYCPGGMQRTVTYPDRGYREVPMKCVYVAHSSDVEQGSASTWVINQLTDGSRDAKQDVSRGLSSGIWAVIWQEDPLGLQPGEGDGPGEGASGAKVSPGTDIWYSYTSQVSSAHGAIGVWSNPDRITDNQTMFGLSDTYNPVRDENGNPVAPELIESGSTGASRANLAVVGGSNPPRTIVAYEETKGSSGSSQGKFLRYQTFNYNAPPTENICIQQNDENCRVGCIVSSPLENARRARIVTQTSAGASGLRWAIFWREGVDSQGGPADIMMRLGYTDFSAANLQPPVDSPNCFAPVYASAINIANSPPLNISSNTPTATSTNLGDSSETNSEENARAHRAVLRGDFLTVAYIYTPDWMVAENSELENYNLYLRHFDARTGIWRNPVNVSNITNTAINVKEPRLQGMPGSGPGCIDPMSPVDPRDCQNKEILLVAWGTETNITPGQAIAQNLDIYLTRTLDQGLSFEPQIMFAGGKNIQGESHFGVTPDGSTIYAVWTEQDDSGSVNSMYAQLNEKDIQPSPAPATYIGGAGCSYNPASGCDPTLPFLLLLSITGLVARMYFERHSRYRNGSGH